MINSGIGPAQILGRGRIEALADGFFAIAMTLLVLQFKVPDLQPEQMDHLIDWLVDLGPGISAYVISFMTCGVFRVGHHVQLHFLHRSDRIFMWMNIVFLMVIPAIPYAAALIGEYHANGAGTPHLLPQPDAGIHDSVFFESYYSRPNRPYPE